MIPLKIKLLLATGHVSNGDKMKCSYFYKVENKQRYRTANDYYWLAKTKDGAYLFTNMDLMKASGRVESNLEDIPEEYFVDEKDRSYYYFSIGFLFGAVLLGTIWMISPFLI